MNTKNINKQKRGKGPMIDGEIDSAPVVMSKTIYETKKDGTTVSKKIWVPLDTPKSTSSAVEKPVEMSGFEYEPVDMSTSHPESTKTYKVNKCIPLKHYYTNN